MSNTLKRVMFAGICTMALSLVISQPAYADLRLIINDSATVGVDFDSTVGGSPNLTVTSWGIAGTITLLNYTIDFTSTQEVQNATIANLSFTGTVKNASGSGGILTIDLIGNNFTTPTSGTGIMNMLSTAGATGQGLVGNTTETMKAYADQNNTLTSGVGVGSATGSTTVTDTTSAVPINNPGVTWTRLASAFSLESLLTVQIPNSSGAAAVSSSVSATSMPEPGSLVLLGTGLLAAGRRLRRKKA